MRTYLPNSTVTGTIPAFYDKTGAPVTAFNSGTCNVNFQTQGHGSIIVSIVSAGAVQAGCAFVNNGAPDYTWSYSFTSPTAAGQSPPYTGVVIASGTDATGRVASRQDLDTIQVTSSGYPMADSSGTVVGSVTAATDGGNFTLGNLSATLVSSASYAGAILKFTGGVNAGEWRRLTSLNPSTGAAVLSGSGDSAAFANTPGTSGADTFQLF